MKAKNSPIPKLPSLQASGYGGASENARADASRVEHMRPDRMRKLTIEFTADTNSTMAWNFKPQQSQVSVSVQFTNVGF